MFTTDGIARPAASEYEPVAGSAGGTAAVGSDAGEAEALPGAG
jgi:hypothetical protein